MKVPRGFVRALNETGRYIYKPPEAAVDFLIVGGGVIGLSIAQCLSERFPSKSTCLVERHARAGEETSSRNSEVIHSGLYYPETSLKTQLCLHGRDMIYERCQKYNIPFRKTGKLVVGREYQRAYIESLYKKSKSLKRPPYSSSNNPVLSTMILTGDEARTMEPDLSKDIAIALWCPQTGIIDSHALLESLEKDVIESEGGELAFSTRVVRIDPYKRSQSSTGPLNIAVAEDGWVAQMVTGEEESYAMLARTLINAAGLSSTVILNSILSPETRIPMFYGRGSYVSYNGTGLSNVSHLIYPCPQIGPNEHGFHSLGTHLTLDLQGKIRFGPDIEWIDPPSSDEASLETDSDFWMKHLAPDTSRLQDVYEAVIEYLPSVAFDSLRPDYSGIRPKLNLPTAGFQDFVVRKDYPTSRKGTSSGNVGSMISLLGIESPGLTSCLAIAKYVVEECLAETM